MIKPYQFLKAAALASIFLALSAVTANAQATRTWVSGVGDDLNPCSRTAPCKTYAGAISKTAKDGEISTLDPGGFGAVTITKSIYINGTHGQGYGSILSSSVTGITVNITDAADVKKAVRLRSLDLNGAPTSLPGLNGVRILSANEVHIQDTVIDGFVAAGAGQGNGITVNTSASVNVFVDDTDIHKNLTGIRVATSGGFAVVNVRDSRIVRNGTGVTAGASCFVTMINSEVSGNTTTGIVATGATTQINVSDSLLAHNAGSAIHANASGARIRIASNRIYNNTASITIAAGGFVDSDAENRVAGNGGGVAPNGSITKQ